ncbi:MAG TPA: phage tail protein [Alphaproteobacteria bacterium]|nr:phage tail protein [Alphaproteobacteria bacterium]
MSLFGSSTTNAQAKTVASGVPINSSCYGNVVPLAYGTIRGSGNLIWYGDFQATSAGSASKGKNGGQAYTYSAYFAFALCEGPVGGVANVWANGTIYSWAYCSAHNIGFESGASGQAPWGYLTSKHPGQDLGYGGTAYVYWQPGLFGSSPQMQNFAFEIQGVGNGIYGTPDADPAFVVTDMLTNPSYGVGFPSARLGSLSVFSQYCQATGMVISLFLNTQQDAASTLNDIVQQCNAEFVWSGGQLTIVPYGDQNVSANGATYTAPTAALYSLTDDDYIDMGSGDPVQLSRARPSDRMNSVKLEWLNRSNQYAAEIVEAKDQAAIETYGLRSDQPKQSHQFCTLSAATMSATLQLQRQAVRNQYTFTLGWKYCLLDPMDIVEITDANLGLVQQWVRILSIEEDDNGNLKITAEEYLGGTGGAPLYAFQSGAPSAVGNLNASPGVVNTPVIVEPPVSFIAGTPQLMIGVSGSSPYWGSADIYMSADGGNNYELIGRAVKGAAVGVTTTALPAGVDPDSTDLLTIDISRSYGAQLASASHGTADNYQTSLWICNSDYSNGELIGYGIETLTGTGTYKLSDSGGGSIYLRRGQLATPISAHATGSMVLAMSKSVFVMDLPASLSGISLSFKFVSYNLWGGAPTDLASATAYSYTPVVSGGGGATGFGGSVGAPSGLSVTAAYDVQIDGTVQPGMQISWTPTTDLNCTSQEIQWTPHGVSNWTSIMVSAQADLYFLTGLQANTRYDFQVRSVRVGVGSFTTQYSTWVTDTNVLAQYPSAPAAMSAPSVATGAFFLTVSWTASADPYLAGYEVAYNTVNTLTGAILANLTSNPLATSVTISNGIQANTTYYVFVRAVQSTSQVGTWSAAGSGTTPAVGPPTSLNLSTGINKQQDGTIQPYLIAAWTATASAVYSYYEVQWQRHANAWGASPNSAQTGTIDFSLTNLYAGSSGQAYDVRVRTVYVTPQQTFYSTWLDSMAAYPSGFTVNPQTAAPSAPTGLSASGGILSVDISWTNPTDIDFDRVQIWGVAALAIIPNDSAQANLLYDGVPGKPGAVGRWNMTGDAINILANNNTGLYFWVKAVNTSGVVSNFNATGSGSGLLAVPLGANTNTLAANAATMLGQAHVTSSYSGNSPTSWQQIAQIQITPNIGTNVVIAATITQNLRSGAGWSLRIRDDGGVLQTVGNLFVADSSQTVSITWASISAYAASLHNFYLDWECGDTLSNLTGAVMYVSALQR